MPLYTFHSFDSGGAPVAMQARDLPTDGAAGEHAEVVLAEHLSAAYVLVCDGEREIMTRHRREMA